MEEQLVGVTHECDFPATLAAPSVTRSKSAEGLTSLEIDSIVRSQLDDTGSIYSLDIDLIEKLSPDLILTQRLCAVCAVTIDQVREQVSRFDPLPSVINLEPFSVSDLVENISTVAALAGVPDEGSHLIQSLQQRIEVVREATRQLTKRRVLFLEWITPPFVCGHWIPELLEAAGGIPVLAFPEAPARVADWSTIEATQPELIIVSECGFSVERQQQDVEELIERFPNTEIWIVDGASYFSRPGPRLIDSMEIAAGIMHVSLRDSFLKNFEANKDFLLIQSGT